MLQSTAIKYFQAVSQERSFRKASEKLRISQSAISRQIKNLEDSLNVSLFDRGTRGISLTPAGRILQRYINHSQFLNHELRQELDHLAGLQSGHVSVAFVESFINSNFPALLQDFHEHNPAVTLEIIVDGTRSIVEGLENEIYDLGVMFNPDSENLSIHLSSKHALGALMSPKHPLAKHDSLSFDQLQSYPLVVPAGRGGSRQLYEAMLRNVTYSIKPALETNSSSIVATFLKSSNGVGILSAHSAKRFLDEGVLVAIPMKESSLVGSYVVASKQGRALSPAATLVNKIICKSLRGM